MRKFLAFLLAIFCLSFVSAVPTLYFPSSINTSSFLKMEGEYLNLPDATRINFGGTFELVHDSGAFGNGDIVWNVSNGLANFDSTSDLNFYSNVGTDGGGNWEPYFSLGSGGDVQLKNTAQGNAENRRFDITMSAGVNIKEGNLNVTNNISADYFFGNGSQLTDVLPVHTAGSLLFSNGSDIIEDNANLFWDNTNKRLGINMNAPARPLHIEGETRMKADGASSSSRTMMTFTSSTNGLRGRILIGATSPYGEDTLWESNTGLRFMIDKNDATPLDDEFFLTEGSTDNLIFKVGYGGDAFINNSLGIGVVLASYPLEVRGDNGSSVTAWFEKNISATGYITRTSIYDKEQSAFNFIKDAEYYKINKEIEHNRFYGYVNYQSTDYSRPVYESQLIDDCEDSFPCGYETITTYPYLVNEEGVDLGKEIDVLRQAVYELNERVKVLEAK